MSMPSIEDEAMQYWTNEVEANCPTPRDKYAMAYKVLKERAMPDPRMIQPEQQYCIEELIEQYIDTKDISELVSLIADSVRNGEVEYD